MDSFQVRKIPNSQELNDYIETLFTIIEREVLAPEIDWLSVKLLICHCDDLSSTFFYTLLPEHKVKIRRIKDSIPSELFNTRGYTYVELMRLQDAASYLFKNHKTLDPDSVGKVLNFLKSNANLPKTGFYFSPEQCKILEDYACIE